MSSDFGDIQALVKLFQTAEQENHSDSENEELQGAPETQNANVKEGEKKRTNPYTKLQPAEKKLTDVDEQEIEELLSDGNSERKPSIADWKKCPKWDVTYRQQVTASDVFLQMGPKNQSTASCENMIITIHLPGDDRHNIDLKILKDRLELNSPQHYLDIPLPQPVDPQLGNAQWNAAEEKLIVTLKMDREFDFMNF